MKVALRKNKGILEFLGFVDGKGRIRKPHTKRLNNPVREFKSLAAAQRFHEKLMKQGFTKAGVVYDAQSRRYRVLW